MCSIFYILKEESILVKNKNVVIYGAGGAIGSAVARNAAFANKVIIMDEPMAAPGVKGSQVVDYFDQPQYAPRL